LIFIYFISFLPLKEQTTTVCDDFDFLCLFVGFFMYASCFSEYSSHSFVLNNKGR